MNSLTFPAKQIRARIIADYVRIAGYRGVVLFTCGNAARALREAGLSVLEISPGGQLQATARWWQPEEIRHVWPDMFDATSGHLPAPLMVRIARAFRAHLGALPESDYEVPTGSGETILCLRWAYPDIRFWPVYGGSDATRYNEGAPLNDAVLGFAANSKATMKTKGLQGTS